MIIKMIFDVDHDVVNKNIVENEVDERLFQSHDDMKMLMVELPVLHCWCSHICQSLVTTGHSCSEPVLSTGI